MKFSIEQKKIFSEIKHGSGDVVIMAGPGSGKTTTLVQALKMLPINTSAIFLAFSNKIVKELKTKIPASIECSTIHALGFSAISDYGRVKVDDKKSFNVVKKLYKKDIAVDYKSAFAKVFSVTNALNLIRATDCGTGKLEVEDMLAKRNIILEDKELMNALLALKKLSEYNESDYKDVNLIDFQDMVSLPVEYPEKYMLRKYDYVFLDEAQDTSRLDKRFLNLLLKENSRLISVGDEKQAIYGFRGADVNSMNDFLQSDNCVSLPLNVSYRCPTSVIEKAKEYYEDIESSPNAKKGIVRNSNEIGPVEKGDLILARSVKPLIDVYLDMVEAGVNCTIVGKEIERGLVALSESIESSTLDEFNHNCDAALREVEESLIRRGITSFKKHPKYESMDEKIEVLKVLASKYEHDILNLPQIIESIFDKKGADVLLMTMHKSKGLESDRVYIIESINGKNEVPSKYAVTEDQLKQEKNLMFVAITRSKHELVMVDMKKN